MQGDFTSHGLLRRFRTYLEKQKREDPQKSFWHDDSVQRPSGETVQIRCEGLHAFLVSPDEVFEYCDAAMLANEIDVLHRLIIREKGGFQAPGYHYWAQLRQVGLEKPEFVDAVTMCLRVVAEIASVLSAAGQLTSDVQQKCVELATKAVDWLNSSVSDGPTVGLKEAVEEVERETAGWCGFKAPGPISVYATHSVIASLPSARRIEPLLERDGKMAVVDLQGYAERAGLWLRDFGRRQDVTWKAGEWFAARPDQIYNAYGLSTACHFMSFIPRDRLKAALKEEINQRFLQNLIEALLVSWELDKVGFSQTEDIDVSTIVQGRTVNLEYDDCSIVPMALFAFSVSGRTFGEFLASLDREQGGRKGENLYKEMRHAADDMVRFIEQSYWDPDRGVVVKPVPGGPGREFCIYMQDRVVQALAAYEQWQSDVPSPLRPLPPPDGDLEQILNGLAALRGDVAELREEIGGLDKRLKSISQAIEFVPRNVLEECRKETEQIEKWIAVNRKVATQAQKSKEGN